jgi:hypothetical protein
LIVRNSLAAAISKEGLTARGVLPSITSKVIRFGAGVDVSGNPWVLTGFPKAGVSGREYTTGEIPLVASPAGFLDIKVFALPPSATKNADICQIPWNANYNNRPSTNEASTTRPCAEQHLSSGRTLVTVAYANLYEMYVYEPGRIVAASTASGTKSSPGSTPPPASLQDLFDILESLITPAEGLPYT